MFSPGEVLECNNHVDTLTATTLRTSTFPKKNVCCKIFCDIVFYNFNPKSHKFMSQKGLTFYAMINFAKITTTMHKFAKINVAKNNLKHNFFILLEKTNKKSVE